MLSHESLDLVKRLVIQEKASIEIPAGCGKTHLLASVVSVSAEQNERSLILTHTHAGVDTIKSRLRNFGVPSSMYRVETIASWAFSLAKSYSTISGISLEDSPNWNNSSHYVIGATKVAKKNFIKMVMNESFDRLLVDEYQDCTLEQHEYILALSILIKNSLVFGDRLQSIFGFGENKVVDWQRDVSPNFLPFEAPQIPHRWAQNNPQLGDFITGLRDKLIPDSRIDFSKMEVPGFRFINGGDPKIVASVAHSFRNKNESVVLIDKWPSDTARHASRLGGVYLVMEDINGNFMRRCLEGNSDENQIALPESGDPLLALWFLTFAKKCLIGLGELDDVVLKRLGLNKSLSNISRGKLQICLEILEKLREEPTYENLLITEKLFRRLPILKIYRWEAWRHTFESIQLTQENQLPVLENLGNLREKLRRAGRRAENRLASRTLLVKGLEYDHVILANLQNFQDPENLYVALSRARKSVTVIGRSPILQLKESS